MNTINTAVVKIDTAALEELSSCHLGRYSSAKSLANSITVDNKPKIMAIGEIKGAPKLVKSLSLFFP